MKIKIVVCFLFTTCFALRDPFVKNERKILKNKAVVERVPDLIAVARYGNKLGAVLERDCLQEVVFEGTVVWGYKVNKITLKEVVLLIKNKQIKLHI